MFHNAKMIKLPTLQISSKILALFLLSSSFHYSEKTARAEASASNAEESIWGEIVYPLIIPDEFKPRKLLRITGFSGVYVSDYDGISHSTHLKGKHFVSEIYLEPNRTQRLNAFFRVEKLAGEYEAKSTEVTWSKFSIAYEHWYGRKFAIKPGYIYQSNLDPLCEIIQSRVSANGLSFSTIARLANPTFIASGIHILKLSNHSRSFDYYIFGELMQYLRAYDWCLIRAYLSTNSIYKSRSMMGIFTYNFQFPGNSGKFFYKIAIGIGGDFYENGNKISNRLIGNEVKYDLTDRLTIAAYYEKRKSRFTKSQFGIQIIYGFVKS